MFSGKVVIVEGRNAKLLFRFHEIVSLRGEAEADAVYQIIILWNSQNYNT